MFGFFKKFAEAAENRAIDDAVLRLAANQGVPKAQYDLGECYATGQGVQRDYAEAVKWVRKAAEQNYVLAQFRLGVCYYNGQGVAKDFVEAIKWYRKAAEQGNVNAYCCLGYCYDQGEGVTKDFVEAAKWLNLASDQGDALAKKNLSFIERKMTREQIAEAKRLVREFQPHKESASGNPK